MTGLKTREFPWLFGKCGEYGGDGGATKGRGKSKSKDSKVKIGRRGGPASASASRRRHLQRWVRWLIAELVIPLLRAHFYCTETESHRLRVFYYRKGVWAGDEGMDVYSASIQRLFTRVFARLEDI